MDIPINNFMTKYEKAKIIGVRMEQLARGGRPTVSEKDVKKKYGEVTLRNIALYELYDKKLPYKIQRKSNTGDIIQYRLEDLIIIE